MKKFQNEGKIDRLIRAVVGIIFLLLATSVAGGFLKILFYVLATASLVTAIIGFCGLYEILHVNTKSKSLVVKK